MPDGYIRGLSQFYKNGLERMEIVIDRRTATPLPYRDNIRVPIRLRVGTEQYDAGLRATTKMTVVWISPDLRDNRSNKVTLAQVLKNNGFKKNQKALLKVNGKQVTLYPL